MGWKPFKAIQRAFTPNPKSFTPANIVRVAVGAQTLGQTGGVSALSPSVGSTTIISSNPQKASVVTAALVGANSFGTVRAGDPNKEETTLNKLARIGGGAVSSLAVGSAASNVLTTPAHTLPSGVQGPTQGLTIGERFGNFGATLVSSTSTAYASGSFAQVVVGLFGRKAGSAILSLLNGDLGGAIKIITTPTPTPPSGSFTMPVYGGSGGGGGSSYYENSGQSRSNGIQIALFLLFLCLGIWLLLRKRG